MSAENNENAAWSPEEVKETVQNFKWAVSNNLNPDVDLIEVENHSISHYLPY